MSIPNLHAASVPLKRGHHEAAQSGEVDGRRFTVTHPPGFRGSGFEAGGLFVWGFTAGLLDRLLAFGGWERPWDHDDVRELPPGVGRR